MRCILINGKEYKHINFNIDVRSDLSYIIKRIQEMEIPGLKLERELFFHSITELINNSLCAHQEKNVNAPIKLRFSVENGDLSICISDRGKGFDVAELPYNLDAPVSAIDINGKNFQIYREKSNYMRFGTGLFNAKKTFDDFNLYFIDSSGRSISYDAPNKEGTVIELLIRS